jgi:hypothetical protein
MLYKYKKHRGEYNAERSICTLLKYQYGSGLINITKSVKGYCELSSINTK